MSSRDEGEMTASPWKGVRTLREPTLVKPAPVLAMRVSEVCRGGAPGLVARVSVRVGEWPPSSQAAVPAEVAQ
jgi:hypothetical protein